MVELTFVEDKEPYSNVIKDIIDKNKMDFNPYGQYINSEYEYGIDPKFFDNYRKPEENMLLAKIDGEVVGFVCIHPNCDRAEYPVDSPYTLISLIMIDKQYRGLGIGHKFQRHILDMYHSDDLNDVLISGTWESNDQQRHIFEKFGFEVHSKKQNHRANGDDTIYYMYKD